MTQTHRRIWTGALLGALALGAPTPRAQSQKRSENKATPFDVVEASVDDVHAAFKSGRLTAHQLVQLYLDRIEAYDQHGPMINSVITLNPRALAEADAL